MNNRAGENNGVGADLDQDATTSESQVRAESDPRSIGIQPRVAKPKPVAAVTGDDAEFEDEVVRLEQGVIPRGERVKVAQAKFEKLEERQDEAEKQEDQWGGGSIIGWRSIVIGGVFVVLLVVILVVMRGSVGGQGAEVMESPIVENLRSVDPYEGNPEQWFRHLASSIEPETLRVMKGYMEAPDDQARSQWVRYPKLFLRKKAQMSIAVNPLLEQKRGQSWDINHTDDTAYLIFQGMDKDYLPFRAYFTQDGEQLKLDWMATTAWSDVSLQAIRAEAQSRGGAVNAAQLVSGVVGDSELSPQSKSALPPEIYTGSMMVRCLIRKKNDFYAGPYNDRDHSAYMLISADKMHEMWGYTAKGGELDLKLKRVLDHGSFVVALKKNVRVMLKVRMAKKGALPSQLELVELLNTEWVTP